jgi:hypothetical protein
VLINVDSESKIPKPEFPARVKLHPKPGSNIWYGF